MKFNYKNIWSYLLLSSTLLGLSACNKFLDRQPITDVTPPSYFSTADQMAAYDMEGYEWLRDSRKQQLYHEKKWDTGLTLNDRQTDNLVEGTSADLNYFAGNKEVPAGQTIKWYAEKIRYWTYFITTVEPKIKENKVTGDPQLINQYLGEAYFFRALVYYQALVAYGDFPIVEAVLEDKADILRKMSSRSPRNEVARVILKDLDTAISLLKDRGFMNNLRINKQAAQLFKSRVALFEGTFEKYHKGTGRVPGDPTWQGKKMAYNKDKTFNIESEIDFFLTQAMEASKEIADKIPLTPNSHVTGPSKLGDIDGWNRYFDMFSQVDLSSYDEVLLWKQYNKPLGIVHDAAFLLTSGGSNIGITRSFVQSFIMKNGLPIYAAGSEYKGDKDPSIEQDGRDDRMQLFIYSPSTVLRADPKSPQLQQWQKSNHKMNEIQRLDTLSLIPDATENKDVTGYRPRKFVTYDFDQKISNQVVCYTGCPVFRAAEAYLNYIEACYVKNNTLDANAQKYWKAIRNRAGINEDYMVTINNTNLDKEANVVNGTVYGDLAVFSGDNKVDPTLYNIRRERRCEFISEGMRWDDLKRWRSWDPMINGHYQVEGINLWAQEYLKYNTPDGPSKLVTTGDKPNMSSKDVSTYIRPLQITKSNNPLYQGLTWRKAYYLEPLGVEDLIINQEKPNDKTSSTTYQNPYWPTEVGLAIE